MPTHLTKDTLYDEPLGTNEVRVLVTPEQKESIYSFARQAGIRGAGPFLRQLGLGDINHPKNPHPADIGTDDTCLKFLTKAPCGDWKEAIAFADDFTLSSDVATALGANDNYVIVQADGDSMASARILDGDLIIMEPLTSGIRPRRGEIALVQITRADGSCDGMIKRWVKNDPVELQNGDGEVVPLPDDIIEIKAVAVARGMITRF